MRPKPSRRPLPRAALLVSAVVPGALLSQKTNAAVVPGTIIEPTVWFRADALAGLDGSGNPLALPAGGTAVSTWTDVSGNARDAVQINDLQQPTFVTSVVNGLLPVIRFDGAADAGDYLTLPGALANKVTSRLNLFIVANDDRAARDINNKTIVSTRDHHGNGWVETYEPQSSIQKYVHIGSVGTPTQVSDALGDDGFHLLEVRRDGLNIDLGHDGDLQTSLAFSSFKPTTISVTEIGNNDDITNRFFQGDIAEIIAYDDTDLDETQRKQVEAYLMNKYGLGSVPEPSALLAVGLVGVVGMGRRARRR